MTFLFKMWIPTLLYLIIGNWFSPVSKSIILQRTGNTLKLWYVHWVKRCLLMVVTTGRWGSQENLLNFCLDSGHWEGRDVDTQLTMVSYSLSLKDNPFEVLSQHSLLSFRQSYHYGEDLVYNVTEWTHIYSFNYTFLQSLIFLP